MTEYYIGYFAYKKIRKYKSGKKKGQNRPFDLVNDQYKGAILIKDGEWFSRYKQTTTTTIKNNEKIITVTDTITFKDDHIIKNIGNLEEFFNHEYITTDKYGYYQLRGTPNIICKEFETDSEAIEWFNKTLEVSNEKV